MMEDLDPNSVKILEQITIETHTAKATIFHRGVLLWQAGHPLVIRVALWDEEAEEPGYSWILEREHASKALNGFPVPEAESLTLSCFVGSYDDPDTGLPGVRKTMVIGVSREDNFSPYPYRVMLVAEEFQAFLSLTHTFIPVGQEDVTALVDDALAEIFKK